MYQAPQPVHLQSHCGGPHEVPTGVLRYIYDPEVLEAVVICESASAIFA